MDRVTLGRLRAVLGLSEVGRLSDDWDELFGEANRTIAGVSANVELWRDVDSRGWRLDIELLADPGDSDVQDLLAAVRADVEAADVQVASIARRG
ncbi:hypothetical protein [Micromonospora ureilytica]|uniref:Phage head maturation protease n=1 Tax=Micromonospora ureilytica TaxID=709868 RepID=A0ABS0JL51_9ACTN|nr:hypothetical protein [Micromonospora ureilytica]MBG6067783.1 phage head maturation protease [Micromonospora ureilytica]